MDGKLINRSQNNHESTMQLSGRSGPPCLPSSNNKPSASFIDGIIELNTPIANELGFTEDKFFGYLWKRGDMIIISFIESRHPGKGNFSKLVNTILSKGFTVGVPTALRQMQAILISKGFTPYRDGDCRMWIKEPEGRKNETIA